MTYEFNLFEYKIDSTPKKKNLIIFQLSSRYNHTTIYKCKHPGFVCINIFNLKIHKTNGKKKLQ